MFILSDNMFHKYLNYSQVQNKAQLKTLNLLFVTMDVVFSHF